VTLRRHYVVLAMEVATGAGYVLGATVNPDGAWPAQQIPDLCRALGECAPILAAWSAYSVTPGERWAGPAARAVGCVDGAGGGGLRHQQHVLGSSSDGFDVSSAMLGALQSAGSGDTGRAEDTWGTASDGCVRVGSHTAAVAGTSVTAC